MTRFEMLWNSEVKSLANAGVSDIKLVRLLSMDKDSNPTQEEKEYFESNHRKYKDIYGMYYISDMIGKVEHALADEREAMAEYAVCQVFSVLSQPSYFANVFNSDENNEEWKTRKNLCDALKKLLNT